MNSDDTDGLTHALATLRGLGIAAPAAAALAARADDLARRLLAAVVAEVPAYSMSSNPELLPALGRHCHEHVAEGRRLLAGEAPGDFHFVRRHAQWLADSRFPLEALLQAYRHLHAAVWLAGVDEGQPSAREATLTFGLHYLSASSVAAAAAYVAQTRALAETEVDRRTELLSILLGGHDESDARVTHLLARAGYLEHRLSFCVALVQATEAPGMENPARVQRIVDAVTTAVAGLSVRALVGVRGGLVVAVFSDIRRASGWTAPQALLADRVRPRLLALGPAVLVGLSGDQPATAFIPRALHEATVALDFAQVDERLVAFSDLSIRRLLVHRGAAQVQPALPAWFAALREADARAQGALLTTLRALADADLNVQRAARGLRLHANTVYARLQRIGDLTGLDPRRYHDLMHVLLAADCDEH